MRVRVLAFASLREALGFGARDIDVASGTTIEDLWDELARDAGRAAGLHDATRFACNGVLAHGSSTLHDGDEVALMPPVGGG